MHDPSIVPSSLPQQIKAFFRRVENTVRPNTPPFVCVAMDRDTGEPFILTQANRTTLVVGATTLLFEALEQEREGKCICPTCDRWTADARAALKAMGHKLPEAN